MYAGAPTPTPTPVVSLADDRRRAFMIKVYQHIALALAVFIGIEVALFNGGVAEMLFDVFFTSGSGFTWLLLLGAMMVVNWFAAQATAALDNPAKQYAGLFAIAG
ncbi:MAG: hypothetical protein ACLFRV_15635, partial [Acidimicrobiales bacterium]